MYNVYLSIQDINILKMYICQYRTEIDKESISDKKSAAHVITVYNWV